MEDMSKTDEGRAKLEEYEHRVNRAIAERHDGLLDAPVLLELLIFPTLPVLFLYLKASLILEMSLNLMLGQLLPVDTPALRRRIAGPARATQHPAGTASTFLRGLWTRMRALTPPWTSSRAMTTA